MSKKSNKRSHVTGKPLSKANEGPYYAYSYDENPVSVRISLALQGLVRLGLCKDSHAVVVQRIA